MKIVLSSAYVRGGQSVKIGTLSSVRFVLTKRLITILIYLCRDALCHTILMFQKCFYRVKFTSDRSLIV